MMSVCQPVKFVEVVSLPEKTANSLMLFIRQARKTIENVFVRKLQDKYL
jgi:hypothetical protein